MLVNKKAVTHPAHAVVVGDVIEVHEPALKASLFEPEEIPLDILFEDKHVIVLNKAAGMAVHPGAGSRTGTVAQALLYHCGKLSSIGGVERPGIVHRLDKGTTGLLVVAKNDAAHLSLARQFQDREIEKIYWAITYGSFKEKEGSIRLPLGRSPSDRKKMAIVARGRAAVSHYRILGEIPGLSFVEVRLETGRTHQIRVHLTHIGHGLAGDPVYGGHSRRLRLLEDPVLKNLIRALERPLLHARSLKFKHPKTGKVMSFAAEAPDDFREIMRFFLK